MNVNVDDLLVPINYEEIILLPPLDYKVNLQRLINLKNIPGTISPKFLQKDPNLVEFAIRIQVSYLVELASVCCTRFAKYVSASTKDKIKTDCYPLAFQGTLAQQIFSSSFC